MNPIQAIRKMYFSMIRAIKLLVIIFSLPVTAIDDNHFYRASFLFQEPRFEKNGLATFETWIGVGETNESRNSSESIVPLFDLYGTNNMRLLGSGISNLNPNNEADLALINLGNLQANDCFSILSIPGSFKVIESGIRFWQNLSRGFFTQLQLPIRSFNIVPYNFIDLSPDNSASFPNRSAPEWQQFLRQFNAILQNYNLSYGCINQTNIGDLIWTIGWTRNFQETEILDFVDTTFQVGVLAPTAPSKNESQIFSIPFGYNGHWGVIANLDMAYGAYEWLTAGFHAGILAFINHEKCGVRIKTDSNQSGIIKLGTANVIMQKGPLWDIGLFLKADHLNNNLSFTFGYTFVSQEKEFLCACPTLDTTLFNTEIVNSDPVLQGWSMSTLHLLIEYDFSKECWRFGPRVGMLFNAQIGGKRVFKNNIVGGTFGVEIAWSL